MSEKVIAHGLFKGTIPPPPYFGVAAEGESTVAHLFSPYEDWKSACGVSMRLMGSEEETQLPTCEKCGEVTSVWAKRDSRLPDPGPSIANG